MKKIFTLISIITLANFTSYAHNTVNKNSFTSIEKNNALENLESQIISDFIKMKNNPEYSYVFSSNFQKLINENPETITYAFLKLQKETDIYIATSTDKKLRIYSWDNNSGGTMRFFDQIVQYNANGKIKSNLKVTEEDAQSFISRIYSVRTAKKETIYLTINNSIYSTKDAVQSVFAYKITNDKLNLVSIFKTKKKMLSSIHCEFDFFSVVERPERPLELITFKNNILNIPLINEKGTVTNKNLIYKWNGINFKYEGVK